MIAFWCGVTLLVAIALWFVVRPLLKPRASSQVLRSRENIAFYRDQLRDLDEDLKRGAVTTEQYEKAKREIESRLLEDVGNAEERGVAAARPARATAYALLALLPLGALAVYLVVGAPAALDPQVLAANDPAHAVDRQQLEAMVERLAEKMKQEPDNVEGWVMLARSYKHIGRFDEAARAYGHVLARAQPDATLLSDYADALAMAQGRTLRGEPEKLIAKALELDPKHLKALALAGSAEYEKKNYAAAAKYWERMVPLVSSDSEQLKAVNANIAEARSLAGLGATKPVAAEAAPSGEGGVSGVVKLSPELASKVAPTDAVLIYARPAEGSRMPLAIIRKQARDLPLAFTLDDTSAMTPTMTISKHERVVIAARVSKNPGATAQPGDFEGASTPVRNTARDVNIVIDTEVR
ncbi:MAG: c-type cytochrome biogenesis protein CcmI [Burkholderiales bacterium]